VHDHVSAQAQWPLQRRRRESAVDDHTHPSRGAGRVDVGADVVHVARGVERGFQPQHVTRREVCTDSIWRWERHYLALRAPRKALQLPQHQMRAVVASSNRHTRRKEMRKGSKASCKTRGVENRVRRSSWSALDRAQQSLATTSRRCTLAAVDVALAVHCASEGR